MTRAGIWSPACRFSLQTQRFIMEKQTLKDYKTLTKGTHCSSLSFFLLVGSRQASSRTLFLLTASSGPWVKGPCTIDHSDKNCANLVSSNTCFNGSNSNRFLESLNMCKKIQFTLKRWSFYKEANHFAEHFWPHKRGNWRNADGG